MTFSEQSAEDLRSIIDECAEFSEAIEFQGTDSTGALPWRPVRANVRELSREEALALGFSVASGNVAVRVTAVRDAQGIAAVRTGHDRIRRWGGTSASREYLVAKQVATHDLGGIVFYALG